MSTRNICFCGEIRKYTSEHPTSLENADMPFSQYIMENRGKCWFLRTLRYIMSYKRFIEIKGKEKQIQISYF